MRIRTFILVLLGCVWTAPVFGQQVVQQPVVDLFSIDTVVSVPDRGSATLGGVRQSAAGRSTAGPFRSGAAWGQASSASSASTHVWIHDFEAMDAALLAEGRSETATPVTRADRARAHLATQQRSPSAAPPASSGSLAAIPRTASPKGPVTGLPLRSPRALPTRPAASPSVQPLQYNLIR